MTEKKSALFESLSHKYSNRFSDLLNMTGIVFKLYAKAEILSNQNDLFRTLVFQMKQDGKSMQTRQALKSE